MSTLSHTALADALIAELARSLETALPNLATDRNGEPVTGMGWQATAAATGTFDGAVTLWIDRAGASALTAQLRGLDSAPADAAIVEALYGLWAEAMSAVELGAPFHGLRLRLSPLELGQAPVKAARLDVTTGSVTARIAVAAAPQTAATLTHALAGEPAAVNGHLEALLDIDLPLVVRFARTTMSIRTLSAVGPGTIVDMERSPEAPVDLLVGNRVIAQGEVVVVGGNYGVRVTKVLNTTGRIRSLEA